MTRRYNILARTAPLQRCLTTASRNIARTVLSTALIIGTTLAIPASAGQIDKVFFSIPAQAIMHSLTENAGRKQFLVNSNAPFQIVSEGLIGSVKVTLQTQGQLNGTAFGSAAQNPGHAPSCQLQTSFLQTAIYTSKRKTAAMTAPTLAQSVMVTVEYDPVATPDITVVPARESQPLIAEAEACETL